VRLSVADALARLKGEGLATDGIDAPARAALEAELRDHLPWYLRAAIGLGAWLATGFLLGFLLFFLDIDQAVVQVPFGLALMAFAVWQRRQATAEFLSHASVAVGLAGFGLAIVGLYELIDARATAVIVVFLSAALVRLMPDSVFRFLATLAMIVAIYVSIVDERSAWAYEAVTVAVVVLAALVWRFRIGDRSPDLEGMLRPVGYAVVLALFAALLIGTSTQLGQLSFDTGRWFIVGHATTLGIAAALLVLVWKIIDEQGGSAASPQSMAALLGVVALGATTLTSPGILAGAAVLTLAFDRRDKVLLGMAIAFLLGFGTVYYYAMHLTLLEKSGVLAATGALLLAIRHRLVRA
jgi:hypothetical protein